MMCFAAYLSLHHPLLPNTVVVHLAAAVVRIARLLPLASGVPNATVLTPPQGQTRLKKGVDNTG